MIILDCELNKILTALTHIKTVSKPLCHRENHVLFADNEANGTFQFASLGITELENSTCPFSPWGGNPNDHCPVLPEVASSSLGQIGKEQMGCGGGRQLVEKRNGHVCLTLDKQQAGFPMCIFQTLNHR